jgi:oligopeptide/dipeptide ABC transporter ATP-binding protein
MGETTRHPREAQVILEAIDLHKRFPVRGTDLVVNAVNGVSLVLEAGETLGIVGESGCGKSTLARLLVCLEEPTSGSIVLDGVRLDGLGGGALRQQRRKIQLVFQDPYASLNPRMTAGATIEEVLVVHGLGGAASGRAERVAALLDMVGLRRSFAERLPHEMSGGQRQRVGIARALAVEPRVLLLDEPVSALDVSVRAEIMNLLTRLRAELGLSYIFISHDVAMVRHISDRVAVMYLGRVVEAGPWKVVVDQPLHPYTKALREAVPVPDPRASGELEASVAGEVPDPARPPAGCAFHPRCPLAEDRCRMEVPTLTDVRPGHLAACHVVARDGALEPAAG